MTERQRKTLANKLARMSENEFDNWAGEMVSEITDAHAVALDRMGWKIVCTVDDRGWPFLSENSHLSCPYWCEDVSTPRSHLRLIKGRRGRRNMSAESEPELTQDEKRATIENDKRVREQQRGTTYSTFAEAFADEDRGGRFKTVNQTIHTAATPVYPEQPATSPFHHDPVPTEPALGFSIDEHPPVGEAHEIERSLEKLGATGLPSGQPDSGEAQRSSISLPPDAVSQTTPSPPFSDTDDEPPHAA